MFTHISMYKQSIEAQEAKLNRTLPTSNYCTHDVSDDQIGLTDYFTDFIFKVFSFSTKHLLSRNHVSFG